MTKCSIFFALFLTLSSCGIFIKGPKHTLKTTPSFEQPLTQNFRYSDGTHNYLDKRIKDESQLIVILLHGLGAHAGGFTTMQSFFDSINMSSIAVDLRGFGHWQGKRGDIKNIGLQLNDLHEVVQRTKLEYPNKKIVLMGESLGSSLALWYADTYPETLEGLIITSLVTSSKGNKVKAGTIFRALFSYTFNPAHPVRLDFDPSLYSNDESFINWAYANDTLGVRKISPRFLIQANKVIKNSRKYLCEVQKPILVMQGGNDILSSKKGMEDVLQNCSSSEITHIFYPEVMHSIVNDEMKQTAYADIKKWLKEIVID